MNYKRCDGWVEGRRTHIDRKAYGRARKRRAIGFPWLIIHKDFQLTSRQVLVSRAPFSFESMELAA